MKRFTVSVPDDVAERLEDVENVSAFVTSAVRARIDQETAQQMMQRHGLNVTDEGVRRARDFLSRRRTEVASDIKQDVIAA
ncbi:hypothetical protein AB0M47_09465 [Hamadaea sp. NPDC051192]|uniref:hypothetical protein n=1 Tax=Hamadaea sp. NPDC051192 TaxID=3154940 RepID=UPI00343B3484